MEVTIRKKANMLEIKPAMRLLHVLTPMLTFVRKKPRYGPQRGKQGRMDLTETYLYRLEEEKDRLYTFAGFLTRIVECLRGYNHVVRYEDLSPIDEFEPVFENIADVQLRKSQEDMLAIILSCDRAQLNGLTAMGKTFLIKQAVRLFPYPNCHIVIAAQQRPIVNALHRDLNEMFPGQVGKVGCGAKDPRRITVATAKSLMKCHVEKTRILFYDEVHTAGAEKVSSDLVNFMNSKMFGFSASTECRMDGANALVEGLFGPVRITITYERGVQEGIVPEIDTHFYRVHLDEFNHKNPVIRKRKQVYHNVDWNGAVVRTAKHWETQFEDPQILVITDTLEHVMRLGQQLPGYEWVYASADAKQIKKFVKKGLIPEDWKPVTGRRMDDVIRNFESGAIRKVISTTTLGTGVDLRHLDVMIRADAGSSEVSNIQYRGRVSRGQRGVYCDFMVVGDANERRRSKTRYRSCKKAGWNPVEEDLPSDTGS